MSNSTLRGVFKDLEAVFKLQFDEFVKQFIKSDVDFDTFFEDADANFEYLETIINDWCENENPDSDDNIRAAAAIFMISFIDTADKATATDEPSEETADNGPLG